MDFDLIIIGAGVAAASALDTLAGRGLRIALIDKARSAGGRCATRRLSRDPQSPWLDSGAQYFTARSAALRQPLERWRAQGWLHNWSPRIACLNDQAVPQPSPDQQTRWVSPLGLNRFVRQVIAEHNQSIEMLLGTRVLSARPSAHGWQLEDDQARQWQCRRLLVTAPPAQARDLLPATLATALPAVEMQACLAVLLSCEHALDFDALFGGRSTSGIGWAANSLSKLERAPARGLWTLHADAQFSHGITDPEQAAQDLTDRFTSVCGLPTHAFTPVHQHLWRYARPAQAQIHDTPSMLLAQQLAIAGDWMHGGRVEGAWLSGQAAARALYAG